MRPSGIVNLDNSNNLVNLDDFGQFEQFGPFRIISDNLDNLPGSNCRSPDPVASQQPSSSQHWRLRIAVEDSAILECSFGMIHDAIHDAETVHQLASVYGDTVNRCTESRPGASREPAGEPG